MRGGDHVQDLGLQRYGMERGSDPLTPLLTTMVSLRGGGGVKVVASRTPVVFDARVSTWARASPRLIYLVRRSKVLIVAGRLAFAKCLVHLQNGC